MLPSRFFPRLSFSCCPLKERRKPLRHATLSAMDIPKKPLSIGLTVAVAAGLLAVAWLSVTRGLLGSGEALAPSPFGPAAGTRIAHRYDFTAASELRHASPKTRVLWEEVAFALGGEPSKAKALRLENALAALRPEADGFAPALWAEALALADSALLGEMTSSREARTLRQNLAQEKHPFGLYAAGRLAAASGDTSAAWQILRKATDLAPDFAFAWAQLGYQALRQADFAEAKRAFRLAIGLMESDSALYRRKPDAKAAEHRDLPLSEAAPYGGLAQAFLAEGHADSAAQAITVAEENHWQDASLQMARAWWWELRGDLNKARRSYDSLLTAQPGLAVAKRLRSNLGLKGGRDASALQALFAIQTLDPLVRQYPKNGPLRLALAKSYVKRGLFGLAVIELDTALLLDAALPGIQEMRTEAMRQWLAQDDKAKIPLLAAKAVPASPLEGDDRVIIPGAIALLGTYSVPWNASLIQVRAAYPDKNFTRTAQGNLVDRFFYDGLMHEYLLAFHHDSLWGVLALVSDSGGTHIDVFGRMIRIKTKISGEGRGTGEASCPGYRSFQGAIWENDDTFEFMAQFQGKENQVRLARISRHAMPEDKRLCELVRYLDRDTWESQPGRKSELKSANKSKSTPPALKAAKPAAPGSGVPIITPSRRPDIPDFPDDVEAMDKASGETSP